MMSDKFEFEEHASGTLSSFLKGHQCVFPKLLCNPLEDMFQCLSFNHETVIPSKEEDLLSSIGCMDSSISGVAVLVLRNYFREGRIGHFRQELMNCVYR